jgi:uncharacterized protein (DUF362 family)
MRFPEYRFDDAAVAGDANAADKPADVYATVRESMHLLGLDPERFGTAQWNPLAGIVRPGDTVVIKPNLVREFRETHGGHDDCLITHGAVIRAAVDYVFIALSGKGRIVIADAPHSDADFDAVAAIAGLRELQAFYHRAAGFEVEVYDLRPERAEKIDGVIVAHKALPGDPAGYARADLGARSAFAEIEPLCKLLYGSEYDTSELYAHHRGGVHEYLISRTVLSADCVISLPKLKTHKKTGITVNMKNLVGINGNKNWLPHHREGTPSQGGDQFADDGLKRRVERSAVMRFKRLFPLLGPLRPMVAGPIKAVGKRLFGDTNTGTIRSGNWYGNDTTWRMVIDLNRILHYADANGVLHDRPLRRFFSVVDGIVAGEGNGPLDPTAKPCGVVVAGRNPVTVDLVCARLMGFDYRRLPVLNRALAPHDRPLAMLRHDVVRMQSNNSRYEGPVAAFRGPALAFRPHFGWRGAVECEDDWTGKSR